MYWFLDSFLGYDNNDDYTCYAKNQIADNAEQVGTSTAVTVEVSKKVEVTMEPTR